MNIRQKFITLLLAAGLLPTIIVSIISYITISSQLNSRTAAQLASIDAKQQQAIASFLQTKQQNIIQLAEAYDFQVALQNFLTNKSDANRSAVVQIMASKISTVSGLSLVQVASSTGTIIASTDPTQEGLPLSDQTSVASAYQGPNIAVVQDPSSGLDRLYITTGLNINNLYPATLRAVYSVSDLEAELGDYTGLGSTGETVITEPTAAQPVTLFPLRFKTSVNRTVPFTTDSNGKTVSYRNHPVMVSSRPVGFSDWTISTMIDESEAFAPITQLRFSLIIICLFSIVIIAVLALYLARIFTEPITRLARASRLIGEGDFTATTDVHSHDEIGALAGSISQMRDSLRSFVASIQSQRNQLAIVLDSTTDSILSVDHNGLITTANQALLELTNLPATSIIGHPFHEILHLVTEDAGTLQIDYRGTGTASYQNVEFESNSHFKHYLRVIVAHLEGSAESPKQSIITIRDETKSRELESMKLDFVSMAAHELRTPLAAIRGYIELINFDLKRSKPEIKKYLKQAMTSSAELSALINNLLDVSRIERGTLTLNVVKTDFAASASRAVHDVGFQAVERSIKLNYTGPSNGYFIAADEIAMREVITNLLTNAIKYTEPGGKVDVTLEPSGDVYKFTVKDTGIGIPASAIPHLFTKFFRVHAGLASGSNGTGLGLFIAKSIVERHEGTISVQSEPGKGSAFSVTIPKLNDDRLAQIEAKAQAELQTVRRHRGWVTKNTAR